MSACVEGGVGEWSGTPNRKRARPAKHLHSPSRAAGGHGGVWVQMQAELEPQPEVEITSCMFKIPGLTLDIGILLLV